ncbi:hypothetical protein [Miltoncostaea marina]|uniref:hypothetical protein n=1 Tax=Miltoncostaea marina TaxID=2843215 RepID=UPI001C3E823C|nr:hypothetical protein [Miltoncostaea marina]
MSPADPTIDSLRTRAEQIRRAELARMDGAWDGLSAADRRLLDELTERLVLELLREPIVRLRGGADGHADSLRHLFALDDARAAA